MQTEEPEEFDGIDFEPLPSPPGELWVSLTLPKIEELTDEQLERWFPGYDGKWTTQTKSLVRRFQAAGLDLNGNWAEVPPNWQCVCCHRFKPEIVRKADNGVLVAHLDRHHDHITDLLRDRLNERFGIPWAHGVPEASRLAEGPIEMLIHRFWDTLICDACNRADGRAKGELKGEVHPYFSFTPSQIAQFVMAKPNQHHEIDLDKARSLWRQAREDFEDRVAFTDLMIGRLAEGRHGLERNRAEERRLPNAADSVLHHTQHLDPDAKAFQRWRYDLAMTLRARSMARDGVGRSAQGRAARAVRAPTDEEFAAFDAKAHLGWKRLPADWSCPCCGRNKRQILRLSNKNQWFAQIRDHWEFEVEEDPLCLQFRLLLYPWHPSEVVLENIRNIKICSDCGDVSSELQRSRPELTPFHLAIEDLRACLGEVRPNQKIEVDLEEAAVRAQANVSWIAAEQALAEHRHLACDMNDLRASIESRHPIGEGDWSRIAGLAEEQGVRLEGRPEALEWLIQEGQRFSRR